MNLIAGNVQCLKYEAFMRGKFIVFEGIDGSGKSSQIELLQQKLEDIGIRCVTTFEPTKGPIGKLLRNIQQGKELIDPSPETLAFLYAADRSYHIALIEEDLDRGTWILCDRYKYSSLAYQNYGSSYLEDLVKIINKDFPEPDHSFLLDISPKLSLERIKYRKTVEIFEKEYLLEKVASNYLSIFSDPKNKDNMSIIDATLSSNNVSLNIFNILKRKYNL